MFRTAISRCTPQIISLQSRRSFHSSATCYSSIKKLIDFEEPLPGASLGTATGRIADEKSGSTPGYTPYTPNLSSTNTVSPSSEGAGRGRCAAKSGDVAEEPFYVPTGQRSPFPGTPGATLNRAGSAAGRSASSIKSKINARPPARQHSTGTSPAPNVDTTGIFKDLNAKLGGILSLKGAPTFTKGDNVIDLIKTDHRKVEQLYKDYTQTANKSRKAELKKDIIKDLVQHSEVEQMLVYPLLKMHNTPNGQAIHDHSLSEHQQVRELLYKLDQTSLDDPTHDEKFSAAIKANDHHVAEEESTTLPLLSRHYTADELRYVGSAFVTHKYTAPTHPHPSAPMQGPIAAGAGMAAKAVDLARDALGPEKPKAKA